MTLIPPQSIPVRQLLKGIWSHLGARRRSQLAALLVVMLLSSLAELVSLGAVLPFLGVLSDPEHLLQQPAMRVLAGLVGVTQPSQLLLPATIAFALAAVLAAVIRLLNVWLNGQLAAAIGSDLSCEAYRRTLYQPYGMHVQRNSSAVISAATTQVDLTTAALTSLLQMITAALVAIGLLCGLVLVDWVVALAAAALFGSMYCVLALATRRELRSNGDRIAVSTQQQLKALQEGIGAIRDILLDNSQPVYMRMYQQADRPRRRLLARNFYLGIFPRYALEALGLVAIALLGALLVSQRGGPAAVVPLLGVMALGAQRLLPMLQQLYSAWATLKGCAAAMAEVLDMLNQPLPVTIKSVVPLPFRQSLTLDKVSFRYGAQLPNVLNQLSLTIFPGERIGLIGSTGSGKSTTVDLLMGLLEPSSGCVHVDGDSIHDPSRPERLNAWRAAIAHVPQTIYLADSSIAENIAFGISREHIDFARVRQAAKQAQIDGFIESCSEGYDTFVGERGIRLSGGQRQRIGIARALYKKVNVLVFDEATSALDDDTERSVVEAIEGLSKDLTLVMIAHRLSTLQRCDRVIRLEQGVLTADGPPQMVLASHH